MIRKASFSDCGTYRYELIRTWGSDERPHLTVVMLNPSTADERVDDPTVRRVIRFAQAWGFDGCRVLNVFALRSTDPKALARHQDPVGPLNDSTIGFHLQFARRQRETVLAAWGADPAARGRAASVLGLVPGVRWVCLGVTKDGSPRHPLYVPKAQVRVPLPAGGADA